MEHTPGVLSEGEFPTFSLNIEDVSAKSIVQDKIAESQDWSGPHDESALSATSDEQFSDTRPWGDEIRPSPRQKKLVVLRYKKKQVNSRAVRRARNLLGSELVSNATTSSHGTRESVDGPDTSEQSGSDSESESSGASNDSELDENLQVGLAGKQFPDGDSPKPDFIEDADLDITVRRPPCTMLMVKQLIFHFTEPTGRGSQPCSCCSISGGGWCTQYTQDFSDRWRAE